MYRAYDPATLSDIARLTATVLSRADADGWDEYEYSYGSVQSAALVDLESAYRSRDEVELLANTPEAGVLDEYDPRYHGAVTRDIERIWTIHPNG